MRESLADCFDRVIFRAIIYNESKSRLGVHLMNGGKTFECVSFAIPVQYEKGEFLIRMHLISGSKGQGFQNALMGVKCYKISLGSVLKRMLP